MCPASGHTGNHKYGQIVTENMVLANVLSFTAKLDDVSSYSSKHHALGEQWLILDYHLEEWRSGKCSVSIAVLNKQPIWAFCLISSQEILSFPLVWKCQIIHYDRPSFFILTLYVDLSKRETVT
jgi:hypothetical protein